MENQNKKLKIIELNLGIEPTTPKAEISEQTQHNIDNMLKFKTKEQEAIIRIKKKKEQEEIKKLQEVEISIKELTKRIETTKYISNKELLEISQSTDLSSLIVRIKNHLKKDNLWELQKKQVNKTTCYYLTPKIN